MGEINLIELKAMVDEVIYSPTKKDSIHPLRRLTSYVARNVDVNPYLEGKITEVVNYAKQASGQGTNKEHWIRCVESSWYTFEDGLKLAIEPDK